MTQNNEQHLPEVINFDYNGNAVSFTVNGKIMVNATEMAKPFGKQPIDWLKHQQSKDFLDALSKLRKISLADLVIVKKGGSNPGTWMHKDAGIEFTRWLCPEISIWYNDRVKELLEGKSFMHQFARSMDERMTKVENYIFESSKKIELYEQRKSDEDMQLVMINFQAPMYLKKQLNVHCAANHLSTRDFITRLIKEELGKEVNYEH
jgi:hypothetical protein